MSLLEYAKRAVVRRVVFVLVALVLGYVGIGEARAVDVSACDAVSDNCTREQAYALCQADLADDMTANHTGPECFHSGDNTAGSYRARAHYQQNTSWVYFSVYIYYTSGCAVGSTWNGSACEPDGPSEAECLARGDQVGMWEGDGTGTDIVCSEGCQFASSFDAESPTGITHFPTGDNCAVDEFPEPTPFVDTDGDGVPDDEDTFPNDPNESGDADGDGVGDNADTNDGDPDNGADSGVGDETDNHASGSGSCAAPPSCSGDAIQCEILYTNWKISCSGARVTGSPEVCESSYTCTGDSAQCASVALLRKTACKDAIGGGGAADEILDGLANAPTDPGTDPMSAWASSDPGEGWEADESGFLSSSRSCPPPPTFTFGEHTKTIDTGPLCDLTDVVAAMVMLMAAAHALWAFTGS